VAPVDKWFTGVSHFGSITMTRMELKDPIASDDRLDFCDTGNRLALDYLRIGRDVLQGVSTGDDEAYLKSRITNAFEALLSHAGQCPHCKHD
jgi:hypothetical protein